MRRFAGQAALHTGRMVHFLARVAFALAILAAVGLGLLSWRLSRGPLDLPWLANRLTSAVNADAPFHLTLRDAALAWEGFHGGTDRPLDIRVTGVTATDAKGGLIALVPRAEVSLSVGWLLLGRLVPRAITIDGAHVHAVRLADGGVTLDLGQPSDTAGQASPPAGDVTGLLREFSRPAVGDRNSGRRSRWSQLEFVSIRDASAHLFDRQLGVTWAMPAFAMELRRRRFGGVSGHAEATVTVGEVRVRLTATADLDGTDRRTHIAAQVSPFVPAALARQIPQAAPLAALDAPLGLSATADLTPDLAIAHLSASAEIGAGRVHVGQGSMPLLDAALTASGTLDAMHVALTRLDTAPTPDGPRTHITAQADLQRGSDGALQATSALDLDQVAFADLPALWPEGTGGKGARPWVTGNITDGVARNGHLALALTMPADFSDVTLTHIEGGIDGHDVTLHWLRPVPPIEHAEARLTVLTPDALAISVSAGRQAGGSYGGLQLRGGLITITGLAGHDQFADIVGDITGPVPDLLTLLRNPKVKLLDRSPLKLHDTAGTITGKLTLPRLPLRDDVTFDSLQIHTDARLTGLRIAGIAAGRDLDDGAFSLAVDQDGLHATGNAKVAGIPAQLRIGLDFRAGPPTQVLQQVNVAASLDAAQRASLGIDVPDVLTGPVGVTADIAIRRDGKGDIAVGGDFDAAAIQLARLNFTKPAGQPADLSAHLRLAGDHLVAVDALHMSGPALNVDGAVAFAGGAPSEVSLQHVVLGSDTDAHGSVRLPGAAGGPWVVRLAGPSLDASGEFARTPPASNQPAAVAAQPGPPFLVDASFDRVILGPGRTAGSVVLHAENDGQVTRRASLAGKTTGGAPFRVAIEPRDGVRRLSGDTADAGGLLRLLDVIDTMQGGHLTLTGSYDDTKPDHPLAGVAEIRDFRIRNAPTMAKLLQAMTLYGLVELSRGPGLGFTRLVAPFRMAGDTLTLSEARAFSASLGMTAKGTLDLARQAIDMQGTIVPAYFFNTLLGQIPFVGKLFSPEKGGGVFSATYTVRGKLDNPDVSVNPLAALTPGFLRGVFGIFSHGHTSTGTRGDTVVR